MCSTSIYEARNKLSEYVKIAESGEPVELTRYNKPVAVIISIDDFNKEDTESSLLNSLKELKNKYIDVLDDEGIPLPPRECLDPNRVIFEE